MKNEYYINGLKIIDIIKEGKYKYFLLEDNSKITGTEKIQTKCHECGKLSSYTHFYHNKDAHEYICPTCRGLNHNGFKDKHHTDEYKKISSERMKGKYSGSKNPMYGKNIKDYMTSEEYNNWKNKISKSMLGSKNPMYGKNIKDYMTSEEYNNWKKKHMDKILNLTADERKKIGDRFKEADKKWRKNDPEGYIKSKKKAAHISRLKQGNYKKSKIEQKVEEWLKNNNIDYDYSCIIGFGENCFQYDFIIHNKRVLIEVQGDYWHGNPLLFNEDGLNGKRKLNETQLLKRKIDNKKREFAESKNFKIIYIWESDINKNNYTALEEIL